MNKEEIMKRVEQVEEELSRLKRVLYDPETKFEPEVGDEYWFIDSEGDIISAVWTNAGIDKSRNKLHNCYPAIELAIKQLKRNHIKCALEDIAERLNAGKSIDWSDITQSKYYLIYKHYEEELYIDTINYKRQAQGVIYCLSENFLEEAIEEIGEQELINYIKGE